jgi:hypothetical protein
MRRYLFDWVAGSDMSQDETAGSPRRKGKSSRILQWNHDNGSGAFTKMVTRNSGRK